jgi:hypothetical protein
VSKIKYVEKRFSDTHRSIILQAASLCSSYANQGYDLTLRQLYYQFIARDLFPDSMATGDSGTKNTERNYKNLGSIVNDARLAGLIDWNHIVDRTREPDGPGTKHMPHWSDQREIIRAVAPSYRIDKWAEQDHYVECWVEKEALAGVLESACPGLDVAFYCCRGYSSQSAMWAAAQRVGQKVKDGRKARIIYLGDHDPSGIDMTRDVWDRIAMFISQDCFGSPSCEMRELQNYAPLYREDCDDQLQVERVALNMDQVHSYSPPPNPAKLSDSRAADYVDKFGYESWELDALEPTVLVALIEESVAAYRDDDEWDLKIERERQEREVLEAVAERWNDVVELLS